MKIETQPGEHHQVKMIVEVEAERLEASKRRAARRLAERGKIPGFRPGKAPYEVILRHYGDEVIQEEAIELLVGEVYPQALEQAKLEPAASGQLEKIESMEPLKFTFVVPLAPEVNLGDYRAVRLPYEYQLPGEDKIDEALEALRRMYSTTQTVERPIQEGDFAMVAVKGEEAKAAEGQAALFEAEERAVYVRKDGRADEWPFVGFACQLIGLNSGQSKKFTHKYPQDHEDEALRGKTVEFEATVKAVRGVELPELNDEFAKTVGLGQTLDELRKLLRADLERRSKDEYDDDYFMRLIDMIRAGATIKYPPQVFAQEQEHVLEDFQRRLASQQMDLEAYLKTRNMEREKFMEEEIKPAAAGRLERALLLDEFVRVEEIEMDEDALHAEFTQTLTELQYQGLEINKIGGGQRGQQEFSNAVAAKSANRLLTRRALERLKAIATGQAEAGGEGKEKPKKRAAKKAAGGEGAAQPSGTKKRASKAKQPEAESEAK